MGRTKDYGNDEVMNSSHKATIWNHGKKGSLYTTKVCGYDEVTYCGLMGTAKDHGKEIRKTTKSHGREMELWEKRETMGMMRPCTVGFWVSQGLMGRREFEELQGITGRIGELCD